MIKTCLICNNDFDVPKSREFTAKYCSRSCSDKRVIQKNTVQCAECGNKFHLKKSAELRNKYWGSFCSSNCSSIFKGRMYKGDGNPNSKSRNYDSDGYRLYTPQASLKLGFGKIKLHHAVTFQELGISKIPNGYHVHHRDCDVMNNNPENLQLISNSDHKWLHKEFGSATLYAVEKGLIGINDVIGWSSDTVRAKFLLMSNICIQKEMMRGFDFNDINIVNERLTMNKSFFDNGDWNARK